MQKQPTDPFGIVGQVLDAQFRVDRLVGEGGFSAVYRGFHLGLQEPIAIKCLKLPPALAPPLVDQFERRFRDESRILYKLSQGNLNIVRSIAGGTWQSPAGFVVPFMILEWLEGRSLGNEFTIRRTIGNQGRTLDEVVKLFGPAADGLGYAHAQGVVHRDLNPGNLFLANTPQGVRMKVLDFGVAKIVDDSTVNIGPRTQTVGQIRIFAPAYGAPEQFDDGIGKVGAASDVYAFALILLEALRDRSVNDGEHLGEFAQKAVDRGHRPTPRALGLEVSDEVEQIFARATKLDPRERWQSAGELWQALAIAQNASSVERHAQAAMETPPLAMPQSARSTKTGMGAPPKGRADKTLPLDAARLNVPLSFPSSGAAPSSSERSSPQASAVAPHASDSSPSPNEKQGMDKKGMGDPETGEPEDEVTRVAAPNVNDLRTLAAQLQPPGQPQGRPLAETFTQVSRGNTPRPAAGEPAPSSNHESQHAASPPAHAHDGTQPGHQGSGFGPLPAPPRRQGLAQTMPLTGAHPLGLTPSQQGGGPLPAAGAPPPPPAGYPSPHQAIGAPPPSGSQPQAYPHMQVPPQGMHGYPPPQMMQPPGPPHMQIQGHPPMQQPYPPHNMADAAAFHPGAGEGTKRTNPLLFVGIAFGVLALLGVAGIAVFMVRGPKDAGSSGAVSVASPSSTPPPTLSAPSPPPPATTEPPPAADVTPDPTPTAPAVTTAPTEVTPPQPAPQPTAQPTPPPQPTPPQPTPPPTTPTPTQPTAPIPTAAPAGKDAGPAVDPNAFNEGVARSRLAQANSVLVFCKRPGWVNGPGTASVTFNTDGTVGNVVMNPPYAGTPAGDCVAGHFKRAKTTPFQGTPRTLVHPFEVPK